MKKWIVCDLDGTLANISHRVHLAQERQWDEFHDLLEYDKLHNEVADVIDTLVAADIEGYAPFNIMILTGRPARYRERTERWLARNFIFPEALVMRPEGNFDSDAMVKPSMLADHFGGYQQALKAVQLVLEDRDKVVEAFRNLGYFCWQVRNGNY